MTRPLRGVLAAALLLAASTHALAQASAPASAPSGRAASAVPADKPASYKTAFEGYRRYEDQKVQPWRDTNDTVGRIGGWRAYAREGAPKTP